MPTKQQQRALSKTLELAGLERIKVERLKWLAFAEPDVGQNAKVHRTTNDLLLKLVVDGDAGRCIHVTGEMRALLDPFHRDICLRMFRQNGNAFSVLYNLPEDKRASRNAAIGWSLKKWSEKGTGRWQEYLRTFDAIAERAVDVRANINDKEIQYSVFGNRYTQLQEKHPDAAKAKRVWLLESEALNEALVERGEHLLNLSADIDEGWYGGFVNSLGGLGARSVLGKLSQGEPLVTAQLNDERLKEFGTSSIESAGALKTMGFVQTNEHNRWTITASGKEYLSLLMS